MAFKNISSIFFAESSDPLRTCVSKSSHGSLINDPVCKDKRVEKVFVLINSALETMVGWNRFLFWHINY